MILKTVIKASIGLCCAFALFAEKSALKLEKVTIQRNTDDITSFGLQLPQRCMFGDFNAISHAMGSVKGAKLKFDVVTSEVNSFPFLDEMLEYRDQKGQEDFFKQLFLGEYKFNVKLPKSTSAQLAILKICVDSAGNDNCNATEVEDLSVILKQYEKYTANFKPKDYTYFLQPVIIESNSMFIFSETISSANIEQAENLIKSKGIEINTETKKNLENAKKIASLPITIVKNSAYVSLPIYSKRKCGQDLEPK